MTTLPTLTRVLGWAAAAAVLIPVTMAQADQGPAPHDLRTDATVTATPAELLRDRLTDRGGSCSAGATRRGRLAADVVVVEGAGARAGEAWTVPARVAFEGRSGGWNVYYCEAR